MHASAGGGRGGVAVRDGAGLERELHFEEVRLGGVLRVNGEGGDMTGDEAADGLHLVGREALSCGAEALRNQEKERVQRAIERRSRRRERLDLHPAVCALKCRGGRHDHGEPDQVEQERA